MELDKKVFSSIKVNLLAHKGDVLLVAVSGGPDSVALLHVLYQLRYKLGVNLHVAHFNHRLRLKSDQDELFVRNMAKKLNLPVHVGRAKVIKRLKPVSEDVARQWRLGFFEQLAQKIKASSVALAHTQNDLAETVLMRILRGAGLAGLRGILVEHQMAKLRLIRPFLSVSRKEIELYLKLNKLTFCKDETNQQTYYLRNKIRLKLLPQLIKEYNPNFPEVLVDLARVSQGDYEYLYQSALKVFKSKVYVSKKAIRMDFRAFLKEDVCIQRMLLRISFEKLVQTYNQLSFMHIQEAEDMVLNRPVGSRVHWPKDVVVEKNQKNLVLRVLQ